MAEKKKGLVAAEKTEKKPQKVRLTLVDRETGESRVCTLNEVKTWDWGNPEQWVMIGGWQITSYASFLHVVGLKIENGQRDIEILVAPRFAMLSGG